MSIKNKVLKFKSQPQPIEISGETFYFKKPTVGLMSELKAKKMNEYEAQNLAFIHCLCDENGERILTMEDMPQILELEGSFIAAIVDAAFKG